MSRDTAVRTAAFGMSLALLAAGSALASTSLAERTPPTASPAPTPPPGAPLAEEHAARAAAWAGEHAPSPTAGRAGNEPGLVAWKEFEFPPAFVPQSGISPVGPGLVAGISSDGILGVFDARRGEAPGTLETGETTFSLDAGVGPRGARALFAGLSPNGASAGYTTVDLSDAAHPRVVASGEPCARYGIVLPGAELGLVWGSFCARLISLDDGRVFRDFGPGVSRAYGGILDGSPLLLLQRPGSSLNAPGTIEAWWLQDPAAPQALWSLTIGRYTTAWIDSAGGLVAVKGESGVRICDLRTGVPLSLIEPSGAVFAGTIVDTGGTRALAVALDGVVAIYDLSDPSAPRSLGTVPGQTQSPLGGWAQANPPLFARGDRPWLAVATADPPGFEVVDVSDASVIATYVVDRTTSSGLAWTDLDDGTPAVVWSGSWFDWPNRHADGGFEVIDTVAIDGASGPRRVARYAPVVPRDIDAVLPVAGRYAAVVDIDANAIALVETSSGRTVDAFGFSEPVYGHCWWGLSIASAGSTFAIGDGCAGEIVDVAEGKMIRRGPIPFPGGGEFSDLAVTSDGSVLSLWPDDGLLLASRPDGRMDTLSLGSTGLARMELDEAGRRAVVTSGDVWGEADSPMLVVDTGAPGLRTSWSNAVGAVFATFVRDDSAIAATVEKGGRYGPRLFDAKSGEPLGPTGDLADAFYYFGPGIRFGTGSSERLVYWNWTWAAWSSAVFDISQDTPRLAGLSEEYLWGPQQLARDDGGTAFELRQDETRVVKADGSFELAGGDRGLGLRKLRRGFWTGYAHAPYRGHRTAALFRDVAVDRPPVAEPGPDRTLECAAPAGTPARLDGSASTDPDSTPGTQDDLVAYAWLLGGSPAGTGPTADVVLPFGSSTARLEVEDALGLSAAKDAVLRVVDTLPPALTLALAPLVPDEGAWGHVWIAASSAEDVCDGALPASVRLRLSGDVLSAPATWTPNDAPAIEVVGGRAGLSVRLLGPDEGRSRAQWAAAISAGGLVPAAGGIELTTADTPPRGAPRGLIARYDLTDLGEARAAAAYEAGADIPFVASGVDAAGNVGSASTSLLRAEAELCASVPASVACVGGAPSRAPRVLPRRATPSSGSSPSSPAATGARPAPALVRTSARSPQ